MNKQLKIKWGIELIRTCRKGEGSLGIGITKTWDQIYIFINLFRHALFIGKFVQEVKVSE